MIINTTIVAAQKKEPRCFVKVEVAVLGSPSLIINRPYGLSCGRMSRFGLAVSRVSRVRLDSDSALLSLQ